MGALVYNGLMNTLGILEKVSDGFPPLSMALRGFLEVVASSEVRIPTLMTYSR
jgi:hypothetical protein